MIETIGSNPYSIGIGIIASVISVIMTIFIVIVGHGIRKRLLWRADIKEFNENRKKYSNDLTAYKSLVEKRDIMDEKLISDILKVVSIYSDYKHLLNLNDRIEIYLIKKCLKKQKGKISKQDVCNKISYFLSRFERKREEV